MALSRACSVGRTLLSRGSPARIARCAALHSTRLPVVLAGSQRNFTSSSWPRQEAAQYDASTAQSATRSEVSEEQRIKNARSVVVTNVAKPVNPAQVKAFIEQSGFEIVDSHFMLDRFTFTHTRIGLIALASEEEARKAIESLHGKEALGVGKLNVRTVRPESTWAISSEEQADGGWRVPYDDRGIAAALQPVLDGRRIVFKVMPPAWAPLDTNLSPRIRHNREVLKRVLSPFGIEALSQPAVFWGDKAQSPRFIAYVDLQTKQGAEQAISALNGTTVDGLQVALEHYKMNPWRAYYLGQLDKERLISFQEKGLAPPPEEIDEAKHSLPRVMRPKAGQTPPARKA